MPNELVGRDDEFALLEGWLDDALAGRPRVVLCGGEPGIGKSRLADELARLAAPTGATAVWGRAVDFGGAPPYWPWWQVMRALSAGTDVAAIAAEHRLAADLGALAPDVFAAPAAAAAKPSTEDRFRQFDAMWRLLRQVTLQRPLVVVLDDVHAADEATLLLLQHLARTLTDERLLILATYRDNDRRPALLLGEVRREPVTRLLDLRGLAVPAVARQIAAIVGHDVPDEAVARVHAATGGNPFFVGELARALAAGAAGGSTPPVPAGVRDAIATRLAGLSPDCRDLLAAASVAGQEFPLPVVAAVVGRPPPECLHAIDEAAAAGFVEPAATPETFRFAHALVRDAVEAGIGAADRVRLHRAAAEAVEALYGARLGPRVFDLARHWRWRPSAATATARRSGTRAPARRRCAGTRTRRRRGCSPRRSTSAAVRSTAPNGAVCCWDSAPRGTCRPTSTAGCPPASRLPLSRARSGGLTWSARRRSSWRRRWSRPPT